MRPEKEGKCVYSNFDHRLVLEEEELKESGSYHQHAAWEFCGYVWYEKETQTFKEEVWRYRLLVTTLENKNLENLIEEANSRYGYG